MPSHPALILLSISNFNMKKFLYHIFLYGICFIVVGLVLISQIKDPMSISSHEANVRLASERIAQNEGPKIVIIGGSGCQFGFMSGMLAEHFHRPVVNTGTHACIGLQLQVNLFRDYLHAGDMVLLIPEYDQYGIEDFYLGAADETMLRIMLSNYKQGLRKLTSEQWLHAIPFIPQYISKALTHSAHPFWTPYSIAGVNEYGDATNWEATPAVYKDNPSVNPLYCTPQPRILAFIKEFKEQCRNMDVQLYLFPPALALSESEQIKEYIYTLQQELWNNGTPFCVTPERYFLPDTLFFDTYYHLVYEGAYHRTNMVIHDLDSLQNVY